MMERDQHIALLMQALPFVAAFGEGDDQMAPQARSLAQQINNLISERRAPLFTVSAGARADSPAH